MKDSKIIHVVVRFLVRYNGVNGDDIAMPREDEESKEFGLLMSLPDTNISRIETILNAEFVGKTRWYVDMTSSSVRKYSCVTRNGDKNQVVSTTCVIKEVHIVSIKEVNMDIHLGILVAEK